MISFAELYKSAAVLTVHNCAEVLQDENGVWSHIPEFSNHHLTHDQKLNITATDRIEVRVYNNTHFPDRDEYRYLAGVFFKGQPVMTIIHGGPYGETYINRYITNSNVYYNMIDYLLSKHGVNEKVTSEHQYQDKFESIEDPFINDALRLG